MFDRKRTASKTKAALIQIEILFQRRRKFVSSGVKVYKDQWSERSHIVNRFDALELNRRIDELKLTFDKYINSLIEDGRTFDFDEFNAWLLRQGEEHSTFLEWVEEQIESRKDIAESSRTTQRKLVSVLKEFGGIVAFSDLNAAGIAKLDNYLRGRGLKQTTIWSYHKVLKTYVHTALRMELLAKDPYLNFRVERGKSEWGRFLTEEEVQRIMEAPMPTASIERVRDLFVLQCLTGLAYADLMRFDWGKVRENAAGQVVLSAERAKTDVTYTIVLLPEALAILAKYNYKLPSITNQQYNLRLKVVADAAGIGKPIASHYGRRTCGMVLLNKGFPVEIVAKVLGHTNIRTTQQAYARILDSSVEREFARRMGAKKG